MLAITRRNTILGIIRKGRGCSLASATAPALWAAPIKRDNASDLNSCPMKELQGLVCDHPCLAKASL